MTTLMKNFSQSSYWFPIFVSHEVAYIVYKEFSTNRNNCWSGPLQSVYTLIYAQFNRVIIIVIINLIIPMR